MNKETAKMEVVILKQRLAHKHSPSSFELLRIPSPIRLDNLQDEHIRQRLTQQCTQLFERTKSEMMSIYIKTAEARHEEYRQKFFTNTTNYEYNQRVGEPNTKLTQAMMDIMNRRFRHINEHLIRIYKLKIRFFVKAPTVKN